MTQEFIPYEQALSLKKLGFNEYCLTSYLNGNLQTEPSEIFWFQHSYRSHKKQEFISAPTFSAAFRWFREKDLRFNICNNCTQVDGDYYYEVWRNGSFMYDSHYIYKTYEDAELACLNKLIEIVKQ